MPDITLTRSDLEKLTNDDVIALIMRAYKIRATAVVRDKDGNIKYDDPSKAGSFGEEYIDG